MNQLLCLKLQSMDPISIANYNKVKTRLVKNIVLSQLLKRNFLFTNKIQHKHNYQLLIKYLQLTNHSNNTTIIKHLPLQNSRYLNSNNKFKILLTKISGIKTLYNKVVLTLITYLKIRLTNKSFLNKIVLKLLNGIKNIILITNSPINNYKI